MYIRDDYINRIRGIFSGVKSVKDLMKPLFACTKDITVSLVPVRLAVEEVQLTSHQVSSQCLDDLVARCVTIQETHENQLRAKCYMNLEANVIGVISLIRETVLNIEKCLKSLEGCTSARKCCNRIVEAVSASKVYDQMESLGQQYENCVRSECTRIKDEIASISSRIVVCSQMTTEEPATSSEKQQTDLLGAQSDQNELSYDISIEAPPPDSPVLPFDTTLTNSSVVQGETHVAPTG
ncbi:uncharacterized protein LOC116169588 isoform X2 [Photinus pyralis]|nr:uncharacterized protein LOC116169504 isoform X2 [Photinus pyralis]XP_031341588.1 uncharacterized protein LOC116169588 isoform X2 [Photinus pyralis]